MWQLGLSDCQQYLLRMHVVLVSGMAKLPLRQPTDYLRKNCCIAATVIATALSHGPLVEFRLDNYGIYELVMLCHVWSVLLRCCITNHESIYVRRKVTNVVSESCKMSSSLTSRTSCLAPSRTRVVQTSCEAISSKACLPGSPITEHGLPSSRHS